MNNKEFISALASRTGFKIADTQKMIDTLLSSMGDSFLEGDAVQIANLGTFEVKKKLERVMVNPVSGQRMLVPPKLVLSFRPISVWREKIKKGGSM